MVKLEATTVANVISVLICEDSTSLKDSSSPSEAIVLPDAEVSTDALPSRTIMCLQASTKIVVVDNIFLILFGALDGMVKLDLLPFFCTHRDGAAAQWL
jgi:hypothetical protein